MISITYYYHNTNIKSTSALCLLALRELRTLRVAGGIQVYYVAGGIQVYSVAGGVQVYSVAGGVQVYSITNYNYQYNTCCFLLHLQHLH